MSGGAGERATQPVERDGRIVAIDILRGLSILWVISFHLWSDMTYKSFGGSGRLYGELRKRLQEGDPLASLTAFGEVVLSTGYHGVALFMILSGLSLTLNAQRRGEPPYLAAFWHRAKRLVLPYWGGIVLTLATLTSITLVRLWVHGGKFTEQWDNLTIGALAPIYLRFDDVLWGFSVIGWVFRERAATTTVASMWFVVLLLQYYLLFPLLLALLRKIGPWRFLAFGIAVTLVARGILIFVGAEWMELVYRDRTMSAFAPFRLGEFTAGMTIGYLLVHHREQVREWVISPVDIFGWIVIGALLQMFGAVHGQKADALVIVGDPAIQLGMVCYTLPILFKLPGRLEASVVARALVFTGIVSFPALFVNDDIRYIASYLRVEQIPDAIWWFFLVVIYVPVGVLAAYPIAALFGLLPKQRKRPAAVAQAPAAASLDFQPAGGGGR